MEPLQYNFGEIKGGGGGSNKQMPFHLPCHMGNLH